MKNKQISNALSWKRKGLENCDIALTNSEILNLKYLEYFCKLEPCCYEDIISRVHMWQRAGSMGHKAGFVFSIQS